MYLPPSYLVFKTASCGRYNFLYEVEPPQEKGTFFFNKACGINDHYKLISNVLIFNMGDRLSGGWC